MHNLSQLRVGTQLNADQSCLFRLWAPEKSEVSLHFVSPAESRHFMTRVGEGYFETTVPDCPAGACYYYIVDNGDDLPDPASAYQPEGVHGPSAVVDHQRYRWSDDGWEPPPFSELVLYELHVGTFTEAGTFEAIIPRLADLKAIGINAIELMPIAQFPGHRNWGYDGVFPFAVQNSYGGPEGLKKLVDACHQQEIAVYLDVVYNHLGPEGNYFSQFAPFFTDAYQTLWGQAINFDGPWSDGVRDFFAGNALHWFHHYHIDGLRLDAVHAIMDNGAIHMLRYINEAVGEYIQQHGKRVYMIAESDLNAPRVIQNVKTGGYGFDAQWLDDFHHALFVLLLPTGKVRYADFGTVEQLAKAYTEGFVHSGEYAETRKRKYGESSAGIPGFKFVAFIQNHDQIGNHKNGDRLSSMVSDRYLRIAAAALLLSPYVPMLFMGEEYGEQQPFRYFTSHGDPELAAQVTAGRAREFGHFFGDDTPPDPQDETTFQSAVLNWSSRTQGRHGQLLQWYKSLIALRRSHAALRNFNKPATQVNIINHRAWALQREDESGRLPLLALFNLSEQPLPYALPHNVSWICLLDSTVADPAGRPSIPSATLHLPPASVLVFTVNT